jgi:hypothetical protein
MRRAKQETRPLRDRASFKRRGRVIEGGGVCFCRAALSKLQRSVSSTTRSPGRVAKPGLRPTILAIDPAGGIAVPGLLADAANLLAVSMFQKRKPGSEVKPGFPRLADESDR